ncbi:MAG: hypothetical protein V4685_13470, partial [Bacteroidota bacterium]
MKNNKPAFILLTILLVPAFVLSLNYIFFGEAYFGSIKVFAAATVISFVLSFLLSQSQVAISNVMRKKYPSYEKTYHRIVNWILIIFFITPVFIVSLFLFYRLIGWPALLQAQSLL